MKSTTVRYPGVTLLAASVAFGLAVPLAKAADIKIGAPLALTGPLADEAKKQEIVWKMWLDKVNAAGGINVGGTKSKVQLVQYDYQSDGQRAAQLAEKLITDDKVDFLLSPFGSGHTKIVATIADALRDTRSSPAPHHPNRCSTRPWSICSERCRRTSACSAPMVKYFREKMPQLKRVAVLGRDDVFPKSTAQGISAAAKAAGLDVYYDQLYAVGTMDHSAVAVGDQGRQPGLGLHHRLHAGPDPGAQANVRISGVKAPIITMVAGPAYKEYIDGLGNLANGVTSSSWWHQATSYKGVGVWPTTEDFYKEFVAQGKDRSGLRSRVVRGDGGGAAECDRAGRIHRQEEGPRRAGRDRHQHVLWADQVQRQRHELGARPADHPGAGQEHQGARAVRHQERRHER